MTAPIEDVLFEQRMLGHGFEPHGDDGSFCREVGDYLFLIEEAGDDGWWLTMVCITESPRMEFAGTLNQCVWLAKSIEAQPLFHGSAKPESASAG